MNINPCFRETELCCPDGNSNQKITGFLAGIVKKKKENKQDSVIQVINLPACQYDDKHYHSDTLYSRMITKKSHNHAGTVHDTTRIYPVSGKTEKSVFCDDMMTESCSDIRGGSGNIRAFPAGTDILQFTGNMSDNMLSADKLKYAPAEEGHYSDGDICAEEKIPAGTATIDLPEIPLFLNRPAHGVNTEIKLPSLRHYEQGKHIQEKIPLIVYPAEKNQLPPEHGRADYYCAYHFRQKYQPPEPVYIYRENPGRFKLETSSEPLKRRLRTAANINGIDNIDIL